MARRPRSVTTPAKLLAGVLVGALAVGTIALVALAMDRTAPTATGESAAPAPTFSFAQRTATPSPTPTAADVAPVEAGRETERFLSVGSTGMWRGVAGACGVSAPSIERSGDGGVTWTDVTPTYRGIGQLISLDSFAGSEAQIVAAMGEACEVEALRTFTQGEFWAPYDDVLAASRYPSLDDPAVVVAPTGEVAAPCADPRSFRAIGEAVTLICEGTAYELSAEGSWTSLPPTDAVAVTASGDEIVVASVQPECEGTTLTRVTRDDAEGEPGSACVADTDPRTPTALALDGAAVLLWSGDQVIRIPS